MLKKILCAGAALFCINISLSLCSSCSRPDDEVTDCGPARCLHFETASIRAYNKTDDSELQGSEAILATNLQLNLNLSGTISVCYKPEERSQRYSLFSTAYASQFPPCPPISKGDSVISYSIYSDKDYDASHPAGSNLNDIITTEDIPMHLLYGGQTVYTCRFFVNSVPADTGTHTFTITATQLDGDIVTASSSGIKLLK